MVEVVYHQQLLFRWWILFRRRDTDTRFQIDIVQNFFHMSHEEASGIHHTKTNPRSLQPEGGREISLFPSHDGVKTAVRKGGPSDQVEEFACPIDQDNGLFIAKKNMDVDTPENWIPIIRLFLHFPPVKKTKISISTWFMIPMWASSTTSRPDRCGRRLASGIITAACIHMLASLAHTLFLFFSLAIFYVP